MPIYVFTRYIPLCTQAESSSEYITNRYTAHLLTVLGRGGLPNPGWGGVCIRVVCPTPGGRSASRAQESLPNPGGSAFRGVCLGGLYPGGVCPTPWGLHPGRGVCPTPRGLPIPGGLPRGGLHPGESA